MEVVEKHKTAYKNSKLGLIPQEWQETILEKSKSNVKWSITGGPFGSNLKVSDYVENGGVKVLQLQDIGDGIFINKSETRTSVEKADELKSCNIYPGDIIISKMGDPVARACIISNEEERYVMASDGIRLNVNNEEWDEVYVMNLINSNLVRNIAKRWSIGSTRQRIGLSDLRKLPFVKPEYDEQKAIANCLNTWDKAINDISELIEQKKLQKKGLMQQLLSGKKRLKGFNDEWTTWTYQELFKKASRPVAWDDNEIYDLISVRRRSGGLFHRDSLKGEKILTKSLFIAKTGDFLMSKMQILHGASGLVTEEFNNMKISGSYIAVISQNKEILNMEYLNWYSQTPYFYHQTYRSSYGVHIEKMTFNYKLFKKEEIVLPNIEEQQAIVDVLNSAQKEIDLLIQKRDQLKEQKKGLMQQLLTGKKRLKF